MSEPKLISPMLDNFMMGDPISEHDGVRCCPAMEKSTNEKYIVKIISVPASQIQLDALLLSGAYSDLDAALVYFKQIAKGITDEVTTLNNLAELEGYTPIDSFQIVKKDDNSGYDVYLLSAYQPTLQRLLRRDSMTHLGALNLGLDMCAALAVARRLGYLYINLKPSNIYITDQKEYRIGDIGLLKLDSLKYASLPDRYRSAYTAPEIADAYSTLNSTIDVYAAGLILYQVFNDGNLPFKSENAPSEEFPAPAYADYEMSEIILKACNPKPEERWQSPAELGQALVDYMQRNGAHDTPIVPVPMTEEVSNDETLESDPTIESKTDESAAETIVAENEVAVEEVPVAAEIVEGNPDDNVTEESIYTEDSEGNLTFIEGDSDETMEAQDAAEIDYEEVSEEVSDMLQQVDELIAHEAPAPVVAPDPIEVPVPPLEVPEEAEFEADIIDETESPDKIAEDDAENAQTETEIDNRQDDTSCVNDESQNQQQQDGSTDNHPEENYTETEDGIDEADPDTLDDTHSKKRGSWAVTIILILLAAALFVGGFFFYKSYYLQTIDAITLEAGGIGELTVNVLSQVEESNLSVICTDTYGIQRISDVTDGKAHFTDLAPNSAYTIKVVISGFHHLTGNTTASYATPNQTEIVQFTAVTGSEDGSVILSFTINGPDAAQWVITYNNNEGSEEKVTFNGHMLTLNGLALEEDYTFTLTPDEKLHITGSNTVTHTAKPIVKAENLVVTGCIDKTLNVQWSAPQNTTVSSWTVRCYNDAYDETIVVAETAATFNIPDDAASYTVEVLAAGMSVSERTFVSENSVNVKNFTIELSESGKLLLSWEPVSAIPDSGWILLYTMDGSAAKQVNITDENRTEISPVVPGCSYKFVLQTPDGVPVLGGTHFYTVEAAKDFVGYKVTAADIEFKMCLRPNNKDWDRYDLSKSDYTTSFSPDEKASFLVHLKRSYDTSSTPIETLFIIRDENGSVVDISTSTRTWTKMWWRNYCELDIPTIPQTPGQYTITTYFNGMFVNQTAFTITE